VGSPVNLKTLRLVLREFQEDDWPDMHRVNTDPEVKRYMPSDVPTEEESKAGVLWCIEQARENPRIFYDLAIALPETAEEASRAVGWCRLALR
jgi:RimJ/RimL family protein N-acetyltransferase